MARTSYIDLTSAQEEAYFSALTVGDRFISPHVRRKNAFLSRLRKKGVSQRSLLPTLKELWAGFSTAEQEAWNTAAAYSNLTGWRLFVKDQTYRVKNDLSGVATPSIYHQSLVGELIVNSPADELQIIQPHPSAYYIYKKVTGTKSQYTFEEVDERLVLPLQIGLSYKADLTLTDTDGYAKFYAIVRRLYQGNNLDEVLEIDLDLSTDWKTATATLSTILGQYTSYTLYFHLYHVQGTLLVDNIQAIHTSQNWVRDPKCNNIHQDFTREFYQVPKHWSAEILPTGASFGSVYPT